MKLMKITGAATVVLALTLLTGVIAPASEASVSFDFFYSDLSPHGSWMVSGDYGRVWQPRVYRSGWNPYHDGHWAYTDCGWAWVSDYTWGDVAYHYGTWVMDPRFGWVWVPGYTWAPAWVTFRTGPDYIGWAPVAPSFAVGFSSGGFSFGASIPNSSFVFVSTRDFASPRLRNYIVPEARRTTIINNTTVINNLTIQNNVVINRGPDLRTIERATRRTFRPQPIERVARVAPFTSVRREQLAVARDSGGDRVRAAEPISARQPLPPRMTDQARRDYRRNPQLSQAPRRDQFRTPEETQAQFQQRDRMQQREEIQQREQRREEIQRQRPQEQRQQRFDQQQDLRRQDEIRRQQEAERDREQSAQQQRRQQVERQREQPAQEQRRYAQPERRQEIERQREQSAQQERAQQQERRQQEVQRQREPSVQQERRQQQAERQQPQQQKEEQPQRPQRRAPKKKNPDDDKKEKDGGSNN
jgi:hypothetical protein